MERNQSKVLAYYRQCLNRVKLQISQKEKEINDLLLHHSFIMYYHGEMPDKFNLDRFATLHKELIDLYYEFFKLRDKYFDIKGKEGFIYE